MFNNLKITIVGIIFIGWGMIFYPPNVSAATDSVTVNVTINNVNRVPVLEQIEDIVIAETEEVVINPVATDADGDNLTITYSGWMKSNRYMTTYDDEGTYIVNVKVSDGDLSFNQDVNVTVTKNNRAPELDLISDITVDETGIVTFTPTATDPDGDGLTFNFSGWMSKDTYTTTYDDAGVHMVLVTVSDGVLTHSQNVTVTVRDVNRAPVLSEIAGIKVNENETITMSPQADDADGDVLTWSVDGLPEGADYEFDTKKGALIWRTTFEEAGQYNITFTVDDGR